MRFFLILLGFAYFLEGSGYAIYATFLVRMSKMATASVFAGDIIWILVGLAGALSTVGWPYLANRISLIKALFLAYTVQALGLAILLISQELSAFIFSSLFFGLTFIGIVTLTIIQGRVWFAAQAGPVIAILTTMFGLG